MEHLHGWFVAAAYVIGLGILVADAVLPRLRLKSLLRGIQLRERRNAPTTRAAHTNTAASPTDAP
jgi:heme exporter protein D